MQFSHGRKMHKHSLGRSLACGSIDRLPLNRPARTQAIGVGPRAALRQTNLKQKTWCERKLWIEDARLDAILGSKKATLQSLRSGVSAYLCFASKFGFAFLGSCLFAVSFFSCRDLQSGTQATSTTMFGYFAGVVHVIPLKQNLEQLCKLR